MKNQLFENFLQMSVKIKTFGALDVSQNGFKAIELLVQFLLGYFGIASCGS